MTKDVEEIPWEGHRSNAAYNFAKRCRELRESNPYAQPALEAVMIELATCLWDNFFSVSEIQDAFKISLECLPGYAAGENRRGDKERH